MQHLEVGEVSPVSPGCPAPVRKKLLCYPPREVAQELCLMDAELLRKIQPEELEHGAWMKKDKNNLAPNILAMVHASNDLAMLVPSDILAETSRQALSKVIISFIKIASCCYCLHNFNSLKAILAGLQCTPIYRLKKTWKEVPVKYIKKFEALCHLMSEEFNYREYRHVLDETLESGIPCIPFLGVLLTTIVQCSAHNYGLCSRKCSGVEDYTVMEAVTVRNRLERLRKRSSVKYSQSRHVSGGNCQEEPHAKTKPSGDWTMDVTILEEGGANSPAMSCPSTKECSSALKILGISSGNDVHDEDGNLEKFRPRSNCLDSKINQFAGSRGDCGLQDSGDDSVGKDVMQSVSDVSLALSDISPQFDEKSDRTAASEDPQGSDHTHLELYDDIRLQEVLVNELVTDEHVQEVSSPITKCPSTNKCSSALKILGISSGNDVHDEDGNLENFCPRSNCLDSKKNLFAGSRGDCGLQDSGDDSGGKDVVQSVSDVSLALSDISLQFDEKNDRTAATEDPQGSDHTHLESRDDIRLQEVLVNELVTDEHVQEVNSPITKRRRNAIIENAFKFCPSNKSICSAASSVDSVGMETSVSGVRGMTSVSSGSTIKGLDPILYETAVSNIDFFAEFDEDSRSGKPQRTSVMSRLGRITRCASDQKVNTARAGAVSASIHKSMSLECIRDVLNIGPFDMTEEDIFPDLSSRTITSPSTSSTFLSSDDEGISAGELEEETDSNTSSPELITPSMMTSPDPINTFSRMMSVPSGRAAEPSPTVAFNSTSNRNTWHPDKLSLLSELTRYYHKLENEAQMKTSKVVRKMSEEEEPPATGPMRRRSRRKASKVLSVALAPSMKIKEWSLVLARYQMLSLGCSDSLSSQSQLKTLILKYPLNSDSLNYKLSHEREPNQ